MRWKTFANKNEITQKEKTSGLGKHITLQDTRMHTFLFHLWNMDTNTPDHPHGLLFTFDFISLEDFPAMNDAFPTSTFFAGITPLLNSHVLASLAEFFNV
jgi:hypothetical protein